MAPRNPGTRTRNGQERPSPLHLGIRHRGTPRQDRRPDLRRRARRAARRGPDEPRRLRDDGHDRPRLHRRRDHDQGLRRPAHDRARDDQGGRLHPRQVRLRLRDLRGDLGDPRAVARHRDGRRPGRRRRPGPDVRLRLPRDRGADAAPDHAGAQADAAAGAGPARGPDRLPAARRQEPGHGRVRGRQADPRRRGDRLDAAQQPGQDRDAARGRAGEGDPGRRAGGAARREDQVLHQPDRPLRGRAARRATAA